VPNTDSAKKRVRQTAQRNAINNWRKRRIKDQTKVFLKAVTAGDFAAAETEYRKVAGLLDKISCTTTLHKNAASRRKSRLAKRLNTLKPASKKPA
jgi:small subunit ribosomal protein S20